jgi:leader peptidase (prepilin peptidase)/N-methyltransferase
MYPLIELTTAAVFEAGYWWYGATPLLAVRLLFACAMIVLFVIDLQHKILPNEITLPGIVVGLVLSTITGEPGWLSSLIGIAVGGGTLYAIAEAYYRIRGEEGLGMGDVKMLAMIGAFLGWKLVLLTLVLSSISGSIVGVAILLVRKESLKYALPFGTFLASQCVDLGRGRRRAAPWYRILFIAMSPTALTFLALTAIIATLAAVLLFAIVRIFSAARNTGSRVRQGGAETAILSAALQEATSLRAQERAMMLRAEASERLSEEIIASLSAGLLVVNLAGEVQIVNPSGRRLLGLDEGRIAAPTSGALAHAVPSRRSSIQCLSSGRAIVRRTVEMPAGHSGASHVGLTVSPLFGESSDLQGDLPLHGPHGCRGARGAAPLEGEPGDGGRAHRRHRARVPQRSGHHSRLQPPAQSR